MTTIYGFKRPDGSVVVDTRWTTLDPAIFEACKAAGIDEGFDETSSIWRLDHHGFPLAVFTLGPDGSITPKE